VGEGTKPPATQIFLLSPRVVRMWPFNFKIGSFNPEHVLAQFGTI